MQSIFCFVRKVMERMNDFLLLLFLVVVGAIIGGGTNLIAIRMIFRPLKAYYIGSFKVPFTPGIIPKRRGEIAEQLGKIVEEYLITPESIMNTLLQQSFMSELENKLKVMIQNFFDQEITLNEWLQIHFSNCFSPKEIRKKVEWGVKEKLFQIVEDYKDKPLQTFLKEEWLKNVEMEIPNLTEKVLKKGQAYFETEEGKQQIEILVNRFFETRGNVGKTIGRFVQRVSPEVIVTREIVKLLQQEETKTVVTNWIMKEWREIIQKSPAQLLKNTQIDPIVDHIARGIVAEIPIVGDKNKPLNEWGEQLEEKVTEMVVPIIIGLMKDAISKHVIPFIEQLNIRGIVQKRVDEFPVIRLEEMLLTVIKKELRVIELIGAVLGGLIGLVQGIIVIFILP